MTMNPQQQLPLFKCPSDLHKGSPICLICTENSCKSQRKCCIYCVDQLHKHHDLISTEKLFKTLERELQKNNKNPDKQKIYQLLNESRAFYEQALKTEFNTKISECEDVVFNYLNSLHESLGISHHQTIKIHILNTFMENDQTINEYLEMINKLKDINFGTKKQTKKIIELSEEFINNKLFGANQAIGKAIAELKNNLGFVKNSGKKYESDFEFSQQHKAFSLKVSDSKRTLSKSDGVQTYTVSCLDKPFDPINSSFYLRIDKNPNGRGIWFGACLLKTMTAQNYQSCNGFKKGTYAIDQSSGNNFNNDNQFALVWNHSFQNMNQNSFSNNNVNIGWKFGQGDIIRVEIDYSEEVIRFLLMNLNPDGEDNDVEYVEFHEMPIKIQEGELYPFVGLSGIGNEVTVLEKDQIEQLLSQYDLQNSESSSNSDSIGELNLNGMFPVPQPEDSEDQELNDSDF